MDNKKKYIILGRENIKGLKKGVTNFYVKYSKIAESLGYYSSLRVKKENGMLIFYILRSDE